MKKGFLLRFEAEEIERLKKVAKKENRSVNSYVQHKLKQIEATPNLSLGNWWDDTDKLRKLIRAVRNEK